MIVGESPAKISAALKKSKCVSLKTLIDALNEESMTWNNKRFLSVAEILAELAELAALAKDGVSVRARGYREAYEYILKAAHDNDLGKFSIELLDSLDADNLMYSQLVSQQPRGYPLRKSKAINDLLAIIDPQAKLSAKCRIELQKHNKSWLWFMAPFNGPWLKRCVADPTLQDIVRNVADAFKMTNQLRLKAASKTLEFTVRPLTEKKPITKKPDYFNILQRAKYYVTAMSNALIQAAIDAHSDNPSVVLSHVNAHFQKYPANGLVPKPMKPSRSIKSAKSPRKTGKPASQIA